MGLAKRIIPCLDVAAGRVVKGINFVNLRDAGDPVEVARRYDAQGADELAFLDIRASVETRGLLYDMIEAVADQVFIPLTVGGGVNSVDDIRALLNAGADKVSINTAGVRNPGLFDEAAGALRRAVHRRRHRRQAVGARSLAGLHARRAHADRARRGRLGARGRCARRRRDPAHQHGPRRRADRLRPRADARRRRRGRRAGDRIGRRRLARATSSTASSRAAPTPCSPRRSSTTASSRSRRRRRRWPPPASRCARELEQIAPKARVQRSRIGAAATVGHRASPHTWRRPMSAWIDA